VYIDGDGARALGACDADDRGVDGPDRHK
jgi:hypothetical protein